jgi:hypothetical protein
MRGTSAGAGMTGNALVGGQINLQFSSRPLRLGVRQLVLDINKKNLPLGQRQV